MRHKLEILSLKQLLKYRPVKLPIEHVKRLNRQIGKVEKGKPIMIEYILHFKLDKCNQY